MLSRVGLEKQQSATSRNDTNRHRRRAVFSTAALTYIFSYAAPAACKNLAVAVALTVVHTHTLYLSNTGDMAKQLQP